MFSIFSFFLSIVLAFHFSPAEHVVVVSAVIYEKIEYYADHVLVLAIFQTFALFDCPRLVFFCVIICADVQTELDEFSHVG